MLDEVKGALRITSNVFDAELTRLINAAKLDMGIAGVVVPSTLDDVVKTAIITYCKMNFGTPVDYDRLKSSYDSQKAQLSMSTGYTAWSD